MENAIMQLSELAGSIQNKENRYDKSYIEIIKYFSMKPILTYHDLIMGIYFSYGWMPTIPKIHGNDFIEHLEILNNLKSDNIIPSETQLKLLKSTINNSIVGTSKLLHFIAPELIPIWDSKVANNLRNFISFPKTVNSVKAYLIYLNFCKKIISKENFKEVKLKMKKKTNCSMTDMRAIEQILFLGSKK